MDKLNKDFKTGQYQYFVENGYSYFVLKHKSHNNKFSNNVIVASQKEPQLQDYILIEKINNTDEFLKNLSYWTIKTNNKELVKKYFLQFFLSSDKKTKKEIFSYIHRLVEGFDLKDYYIDFINYGKGKNINEFINYFSSSFPISVWNTKKINFDDMQNEILKTYSQEDTYKFWLSFFRKRKNQIKDVNTAPIVANFLLNQYGNDPKKINSFYSFFPYLRAQIEKIEPDIFDFEHDYSTILPINLKKMVDSFGIPKFSKDSYMDQLLSLSNSISKYYNLDFNECTYQSKQKGNIHINFYHSNPLFTTSLAKKIIIDYFSYIKNNQFELCEENIMKWLEYYNISKSIENKKNDYQTNKTLLKI